LPGGSAPKRSFSSSPERSTLLKGVSSSKPFVFDKEIVESFAEANLDDGYLRDFIANKKRVNGYVVDRRVEMSTLDKMPKKYAFFSFRRDPIYNSALLEKVMNCFMRDGKKEKIRRIFYDMFTDEKNDYSIDSFYGIILALRPSYINVLVRRGAEVYRVPIKASPLKSTIRAIRFFKLAVLARVNEDTLEDKIRAEVHDSLFTFGYYNPFHKEYVELSEKHIHLSNYRTKKVY